MMDPQVLILTLSFFTLLVLNVPVAVSLTLATMLTILSLGSIPTSYVVAQRLTVGIASFPLLAIPFFVLAGILMGHGGMARRLMDFAATVVGRFHGGLSYVTTLTCMLFGAVSGSAAAAVSSVGGFMIPEMDRKGYGREFAVALTTTSATTGLLIPPSNIMIVYAVVAGNVSVAGLFLGGVLPGVVMGMLILAVCFFVTRRQDIGFEERSSGRAIITAFFQAVPSLVLVILILGGIISGIFSATEASAIAVAYALLLGMGVYREITIRELPKIILQAGKTTAVVMLLIGASQAMGWVLALEQVPQQVSEALLGLSDSKLATLLLINLLLLVVGTFMDMTPAVLIFTPIFLPVVTSLGIHPVHFGILMIANLCIGLCTPPVGACLFIGCGVGKTSIAKVTPQLLPIFGAMVVGLALITYVPAISMWLPQVTGLIAVQ